MEDILRAIALGVVQGLSEFLPISSSGHLIITRDLFGWEFADDLTFDVSLHLGTTLAVLAFFWREWLQMFQAAALRILGRTREVAVTHAYDEKLLVLLIIGSIPVAVIGLALESWVEDNVRDPIIVGAMLIVFGVILWAADNYARHSRDLVHATWVDSLLIGGAQAISLIPGVSRSGSTITAGLFRGLHRQDAARFSFLLSTPAIGGAALLKLSEAASDGVLADEADVILAGAITSFVVGIAAIGYLMRLIQTRSFAPFVAYRLAAGVFVIAYFALR